MKHHIEGGECTLTDEEKYSNAQKYVNLEGLDIGTKNIYAYEAELCDKVIEVMEQPGLLPSCPWCGGRTFRMGEILIDFQYPFVSDFRVQVLGQRRSEWVTCMGCGLSKKVIKIPVGDKVAIVKKTVPPTMKLVSAECPVCNQAPCEHTAKTIWNIQNEEPEKTQK